MLYKPTEVSQFLDIPSSTLRRYARLFAKYLSPSAQLRRRKYTSTDLEIIEKIKTLSAEGVPIDEIGPRLDEMPIEHEPMEPPAPNQRAIMPVNPEVIKKFDHVDDKLDLLLAEIAQLRTELEQQRDRSLLDRILGRGSEKKPPE